MSQQETPQEDRAAQLIRTARKDLTNFRGYVHRTGLTGWVNRNAAHSYERAYRSVVAVEDAIGTQHPTTVALSERLRGIYNDARRAGLLRDEQIGPAEQRAIASLDRARSAS